MAVFQGGGAAVNETEALSDFSIIFDISTSCLSLTSFNRRDWNWL